MHGGRQVQLPLGSVPLTSATALPAPAGDFSRRPFTSTAAIVPEAESPAEAAGSSAASTPFCIGTQIEPDREGPVFHRNHCSLTNRSPMFCSSLHLCDFDFSLLFQLFLKIATSCITETRNDSQDRKDDHKESHGRYHNVAHIISPPVDRNVVQPSRPASNMNLSTFRDCDGSNHPSEAVRPTGGTGAPSTTRPQAAAQAPRSARATIRWFSVIVKSCVQRV